MVALCEAFRAQMTDNEYKRRFIHTLFLFNSFILVGLCKSLTGPTLLDLQLITNTNTEQASIFITGASIGTMVGSITMGFIYERWNKTLLMFLTLFGLAIAVTILPWCAQYSLMIVMHGLVSMFKSAFLTGGNSDLMRTWQSERRVFLQILHFSYGLGETFGPLVAEPFLVTQEAGNKTYRPSNSSILIPLAVACVDPGNTINASYSQFVDTVICEKPNTRVQWAYLISGSMAFLGTFLFCIEYCCFETKDDKTLTPLDGYERLEKHLPLRIYIVTLGFIFFIFFFIDAIEIAISSYIMMFAVTYLNWSKSAGANLISVFWACFASWRFATIFFIQYFPPFLLLVVTSCVMLASSVGALMSSITRIDTGLWICVALMGLSLASQFTSTMMWTEESVMRLSPKIVSLIVFSCTFPDMVSPPLIGYLMQEVSPLWLFYLLTIECGVCLLLLCMLYVWNRLIVQTTLIRANLPDTKDTANQEN